MWRRSGREDRQVQDYLRWRDLSFLQDSLQEEIQEMPSEVREVASPTEQLDIRGKGKIPPGEKRKHAKNGFDKGNSIYEKVGKQCETKCHLMNTSRFFL